MPKQTFALEKGGPKNLEFSWKGMWKNFEITLDGQVIGGFENQKALKEGQVFTLPDGSSLEIKLNQSLMGTQLNVLRNGVPLPGTAGDPEQKLKGAYGLLYFIAGLNLLLGVLSLMIQSEFLQQIAGGWYSVIYGLAFLTLAFFVKKQSQIALGISIVMYGLDSVFIVMNSDVSYNFFIRLLFLYFLWQGFGAIKELNENSEMV